MKNEEKCKKIIEKIVEITNDKGGIKFEEDFGSYTLTVRIGKEHTHIGIPGKDGSFDQLVDNLYSLLIENTGLSWVDENNKFKKEVL